MRFSDIISAGDHNQYLIEAAAKDTLPHAMLFWGSPGSGKLATALALAQYLMCKDRQPEGACGICGSCVKSSQLLHPDIHFSFPGFAEGKEYVSTDLYPAWRQALLANPYLDLRDWMDAIESDRKQLNLSVKEAQRIVEQLSMHAFEGGNKVQLIWLPEYFGTASNILLKLIEEPPDGTILILVTEERRALLPTILSRCQQLLFKPVPHAMISDKLESQYDIERARAERIAVNCHGNWNLAMRMASKSEFNPVEWMQQWIKVAWAGDYAAMRQWSDQMNGFSREENKQYLRYVIDVCQKLFWTKWGIDFYAEQSEQAMLKWLNTKIEFNELEQLVKLAESNLRGAGVNAKVNLMWFDATLKLRTALRMYHGKVEA